MIITDSDRDSTLNSKSAPTVSSDSSDAGSSSMGHSGPPPPYIPSYTQPRTVMVLPPPPPSPFPHDDAFLQSLPFKKRRSPIKRFCRAFLIALGLYMVLASLVRLVQHFATSRLDLIWGEPSGPLPSDGNTSYCVNPNDHSVDTSNGYASHHSFTFPLSAKSLYFLSRGDYNHGSLRFAVSENRKDDIGIGITVHYPSHSAINKVRICSLERINKGYGMGFYTPDNGGIYLGQRIKFEAVVTFPPAILDHPLHTDLLRTSMSNWRIEVDDIKDHISFGSVMFSTTNGAIHVGPMSTKSANMKTTNGEISGTFNASDSLVLESTNGAIIASVGLLNGNGAKPTELFMKTSNGKIQAPIYLTSTTSSTTLPPFYKINAITTNGRLQLAFPEAPVSPFSKLDLTAYTTNGKAELDLHPTFEGEITQITSAHDSKVNHRNPQSPDPSGNGRKRAVSHWSVAKRVSKTRVWWGLEDDKTKPNLGTVLLSTTNGNNILNLN